MKECEHGVLMSIDPGTRHLGVAVFRLYDVHREGRCIEYFPLDVGKKHKWEVRTADALAQVMSVCSRVKPKLVIIEQPQLFLSSSRGRAASNSGAVMKLTAVVFALYGALVGAGMKCELVPVSRWKGNVPKRITEKRVLLHWGCRSGNDNVIDAVGLGDWYIRKHLKYTPRRD